MNILKPLLVILLIGRCCSKQGRDSDNDLESKGPKVDISDELVKLIKIKINENDKENARTSFDKSGLDGLINFTIEKRNEWEKIPLDIGIIGNSRVGKSSFINAMRGLTGDDYGAAPAGNKHTTMVPTPYEHPRNKLLRFWDLPGVRAPHFQKDVYLDLINFDFFLLLSANRFTETDVWLAKKFGSNSTKKPFYFVRTQMMLEIVKDKQAHLRTHRREAVIADIRQDIDTNLRDLHMLCCSSFEPVARVFLIDNYATSAFDFQLLVDHLSLFDAFPRVKRNALMRSLNNFSEGLIKEKIEKLAHLVIPAAKFAAVLTGALSEFDLLYLSPLPSFGVFKLYEVIFKWQIGLDIGMVSSFQKRKFLDAENLNVSDC